MNQLTEFLATLNFTPCWWVPFADFYERFIEWLPADDRPKWGRADTARDLRTHVELFNGDGNHRFFAHRNDFENHSCAEDVGARVEFTVVETPKGFRAENVRVIDDERGREHGEITRKCNGFGFLKSDYGGETIFFHVSELLGQDWPEDLRGTRVTFNIGTDRLERLRAIAVKREGGMIETGIIAAVVSPEEPPSK